ncbi:Spy/CpxP family protein refolding chaperone [Candidatus Aminicenantes bacterium AH-873-B07]|jgi:Spy/CpxP family protein refolding chaperone|nr:Spy/CpxP family protein refolding chaperone [Candidatus Aminicenantes bacterium AH-873-B07]
MKRRILILVSALIFLSLILLPINNYAQKCRRPLPGGWNLILGMERFLDLTEEQKSKLEELRKKWIEERWDFQDRMKRLRFKLRELLRDPEADEKEIENIIDEISKLRSERFKGMLRHRKEIRNLLTPDQLSKFEKFKKEFIRRRALRERRFLWKRRFFRPRFRMPSPFCPFHKDWIF